VRRAFQQHRFDIDGVQRRRGARERRENALVALAVERQHRIEIIPHLSRKCAGRGAIAGERRSDVMIAGGFDQQLPRRVVGYRGGRAAVKPRTQVVT